MRKENVVADGKGSLDWFRKEEEELLRVDCSMESKYFQNYSVITCINRRVVSGSVSVFRYEDLEL